MKCVKKRAERNQANARNQRDAIRTAQACGAGGENDGRKSAKLRTLGRLFRAISESLGSVTSAVTAINDMSTQIATAAATEQSSVTEEINRNVFAIQEIVNELLHSSEDAARVSQTVSQEGINLGKLVGQFKDLNLFSMGCKLNKT